MAGKLDEVDDVRETGLTELVDSPEFGFIDALSR